MKPALGSCLFFLICVLTCLAYSGAEESLCTKGAICATSLAVSIGEEPRPVAVWSERGNEVTVIGPGVKRPVRTSSEGKWLNFTATQRGSEYCVSSEAFPEKEFCDTDQDALALVSFRETKWDLEPAHMTSGCSQYYLLSLSFGLHDSPTKLLWRPGERAESLYLAMFRLGSGDEFILPRKADSQLQYDLTFQRVSGDASCIVTSASLDVSRTCQNKQTGIISLFIISLGDNGVKTPSYFSFNCEDGADPTGWYIAAGVGFVFVIAFVAVVAWKAKARQGDQVRPPPPLPSPSPAGTLGPLPAPPPQLLPQWN